MKAYAAALCVKRSRFFGLFGWTEVVRPYAVTAQNADEAEGITLRLGRKDFPRREGWCWHEVALVEINLDSMVKACKEE